MLDNIKVILQYILPKQALTRFVGWVASKQAGWLTQLVVKVFTRYYRINMQTAQNPDQAFYATFNDFFSRPLIAGVRPITDKNNWLSLPADGTISQLGLIRNNMIFQAKGHHYSLEALLASNSILVEYFRNGLFVTTYLAPHDYHRVHMPCIGVLREMIYVPGNLFSVNPLTAAYVPNLFARNERVICVFNTVIGLMAQILVGATIVGSIETVWAGTITPPREGVFKRWTYPATGRDGAIVLGKGAEMGRFKLGSTVINLFAEGSVQFAPELHKGSVTRMGEAFAEILAIVTLDTKESTLCV